MRAVAVLVASIIAVACASPAQPTSTPSAQQTTGQPTPTGQPTSGGQSSPTGQPTATTTPTPASTPSTTPSSTPSVDPGSPSPVAPPVSAYEYEEFDVPAGTHPHDVAPASDGTIYYTAQNTGRLGRLDPATGETIEIPLGEGSAPHGVIVGPDDATWITDGGLNAIVRLTMGSPGDVPMGRPTVQVFELPRPANANLNTAAFDGNGTLWFTGQAGVYGSVDPATGEVEVFDAPRGPGPYGIDATPDGGVWFVSLEGSYVAEIDTTSGEATVFEPPTAQQGARRVWSDSRGRLWVSEWDAGQLGMYDPSTDEWREWPLPGANPMAYAVYVDELDLVWVTDFGSNAIVRFDPASETFESLPLPTANAAVRQLLGRDRELWGAESAVDKLVVLRRTE